MRFDNFDIDRVAQYPRRGIQQLQTEIDTDTHIGRKHYGDISGCSLNLLLLLVIEASGTDDHTLAVGTAQFEVSQ